MAIFPESWGQSTPWKQALLLHGMYTEGCVTVPPPGYRYKPVGPPPSCSAASEGVLCAPQCINMNFFTSL